MGFVLGVGGGQLRVIERTGDAESPGGAGDGLGRLKVAWDMDPALGDYARPQADSWLWSTAPNQPSALPESTDRQRRSFVRTASRSRPRLSQRLNHRDKNNKMFCFLRGFSSRAWECSRHAPHTTQGCSSRHASTALSNASAQFYPPCECAPPLQRVRACVSMAFFMSPAATAAG